MGLTSPTPTTTTTTMPSSTTKMPPPTTTTPPTLFTPFPFLPTELRLSIWRLSHTPRVVSVRYSLTHDRCLSSTPPPSIAHVCRESRYEALHSNFYVLAFSTPSHPTPSIWFSPSLDTLYIPRWGHLGYADAARDFAHHVLDTAPYIRRLAIDHVRPEVRRPWETYSKYWLMRGFPLLREAFLVLGAEDEDVVNGGGQGQIEFVDPRGGWDEIRGVMDKVKASFGCEVGMECVCWDDGDGLLDLGMGVGPCLELIPKAKAVHVQGGVVVVA